MTVPKWLVAAAAIAASAVLHGAAVGHFVPSAAAPDFASGGAAAIPLLGDSFSGRAAGTVAAPVTSDAAPKAGAQIAPASPVTEALAPVVPLATPSLRKPGHSSPSPSDAALSPVPELHNARPKARPNAEKSVAISQPKAAENANLNRKEGSVLGTTVGVSESATADKSGLGDGGKAAASYGSTVLRKIAKIRKAKAPAKGRVIVGFAIAANGNLQSVRVVTSSGNAGLDNVAIDHFRRAAPFPVPPPKAQREFAFEFLGKR